MSKQSIEELLNFEKKQRDAQRPNSHRRIFYDGVISALNAILSNYFDEKVDESLHEPVKEHLASEKLRLLYGRIENMRDGAIFERNKYDPMSHSYAYFQATTNAFEAVLNVLKEEGVKI